METNFNTGTQTSEKATYQGLQLRLLVALVAADAFAVGVVVAAGASAIGGSRTHVQGDSRWVSASKLSPSPFAPQSKIRGRESSEHAVGLGKLPEPQAGGLGFSRTCTS